MQRWEYHSFSVYTKQWGEILDELDKLGNAGWELVVIDQNNYILKRPEFTATKNPYPGKYKSGSD